jgi:5-(carboxyamino)imidazole ribonucleotide mutase
MDKKIDVAIIVGSDSDLETIQETRKVLDSFGVGYSVNIASAHRTVKHLENCIQKAQSAGAKIFIAGAGMAAALPGAIAAQTLLPVIGVPMEGSSLSNFDSVFSMLQMPKGVPVATVAVGKTGATNAAILAIQILAIFDDGLKQKLIEYKKQMADVVIGKDLELQSSLKV